MKTKRPEEKKVIGKLLNKTDIFVLAFGAMIGWAWVVLSGEWIASAGTLGAILAFVTGGIVVLFVGQIYAELTSAMAGGAGVLEFSMRGLGYRCSFICTWALVLGYLSVIAFEAVALPSVMEYLFPNYACIYMYTISGFDIYLTWAVVGIVSSIIIAGINYIGIKTAATLQKFLTVLLGVVGLALIFGSFSNGSVENARPLFEDGFQGVITVLAMTPFMYIGFDVIPQASREMDIPQKKVGRILVLSVTMAICWYVLIILGVSLSITPDQASASILPTADAMGNAYNGSSIASKILICGGIAGIITSWNSFYIGGSRAIYYMAKSGMLPAFLGKLHPKHKTPSNAIILLGVISSLAPLFGKNMLIWLSNSGGFAIILSYAFVSVAFLKIRKKEPSLQRPYEIKKWRFVGVGSVILCVVLAIMYLPMAPAALKWPYEWIIVLIWLLLGTTFYLVARMKNKTRTIKEKQVAIKSGEGGSIDNSL